MEVATQRRCDGCFRPIKSVKDGWVEWWSTGNYPNMKAQGLRLVHHKPASPLANSDNGCYYHPDSPLGRGGYYIQDLPLYQFMGPAGLMMLFSLLEEGGLPQGEVLEMCKRLHVPGYEKARSGR